MVVRSSISCILILIPFFLGGCGGPQSILNPAGPSAYTITGLWWGMFIFFTLVVLIITILWLYAMWRKPARLTEKQARLIHNRWIINGGLVLPIVSITILLSFDIPMTGYHMLPLPLAKQTPLRIEVTGRQWRWEIRYPDAAVMVVNTLHIPAGVPIDIHVSSNDVIHSFWVPRLAGKIDAIPGRTNIIRLESDKPGRFRGQCSEFCGFGHAHMILQVEAHTPKNFEAWLEAQKHDN